MTIDEKKIKYDRRRIDAKDGASNSYRDKKIISQHPEINWETLAKDAIWNYVKKLQLADKITNKSKLNCDDVEIIDRAIKKSLLERYRIQYNHK